MCHFYWKSKKFVKICLNPTSNTSLIHLLISITFLSRWTRFRHLEKLMLTFVGNFSQVSLKGTFWPKSVSYLKRSMIYRRTSVFGKMIRNGWGKRIWRWRGRRSLKSSGWQSRLIKWNWSRREQGSKNRKNYSSRKKSLKVEETIAMIYVNFSILHSSN